MTRLLGLLLPLGLGLLAACSLETEDPVGFGSTDPDGALPTDDAPPDRVELGELTLRLRAELQEPAPGEGQDRVEFSLTVENGSGQRVVRELAGGCIYTPRLYEEGEWIAPTWEAARCPSDDDSITVDLDPGERAAPEAWTRRATVGELGALGVTPGLYRPVALLERDLSGGASAREVADTAAVLFRDEHFPD